MIFFLNLPTTSPTIRLQQYVDEFCFRLNNRDRNTAFLKCVGLAEV